MFNSGDIDAVLNNAQAAVDSLAQQTGELTGEPAAAHSGTPAPRSAVAHYAPESARKIERILKLRVPVVVRLAERTLRTAEIMKLAPGSIVEFDRQVTDELDLMVNNRQIGTGHAVKIGEHYGLRVGYIGDAKQRIASLRSPG